MKYRKQYCCFCGSRLQNLPYDETNPLCIKIKDKLKKEIIHLINDKNVIHFFTSMEVGIDMWAAEILISLKNEYPKLILEVIQIQPFNQECLSFEQKQKQAKILAICDFETILTCKTHQESVKTKNQYMINRCDYFLVLWDLAAGPTSQALSYANRLHKKIICFNAITSEYFKYR